MTPTLEINDRVVIDKVSYRFHDPHRGDIVVFRAPPKSDLANADLIKRVVGLPGDRIEAHDNRLYVNGKALREPYLAPGTRNIGFLPITVPAGSYWLMGDNRPNSNDSRKFGAVRRRDIVGRAMIRIWPLSRLAKL